MLLAKLSFLEDALCEAVVLIRVAELRPPARRVKSLTVTKSDSLNHLIVADQCAMGLFTGVLAKTVTRVHSKLDQPPVNVLAIFTQISWLWIALPFNFRAVGIEQCSLEPVPDDFLIVFRIRPAKSRVDVLCQGADRKKQGDGEGQLHAPMKNKTTEIVDQIRCAFVGFPHSTGFPLQVNRARILE